MKSYMRGYVGMIIAKNDEAKRSRIWRVTVFISSVLIVVIAVYLLMKMFTANPLEGTWECEDENIRLTVSVNGTMTVRAFDISEDGDVDVRMAYTMDKDTKTVTIKEDMAELEELAAASDGAYTAETLKSAVAGVVTTFNYSIEGRELILTEREYGEQLAFIKK